MRTGNKGLGKYETQKQHHEAEDKTSRMSKKWLSRWEVYKGPWMGQAACKITPASTLARHTPQRENLGVNPLTTEYIHPLSSPVCSHFQHAQNFQQGLMHIDAGREYQGQPISINPPVLAPEQSNRLVIPPTGVSNCRRVRTSGLLGTVANLASTRREAQVRARCRVQLSHAETHTGQGALKDVHTVMQEIGPR